MASWARADTKTRAIRVAGPPSTTAVMQKGMENAAVNIGRSAPAPTGPNLRTWMSVDTPTTRSEANIIHDRYESPKPDALATTTGVTRRVTVAIKLN